MLERLARCNDESFYAYFSENMDDLGLEAPHSLFGSFQTAVEKLGLMAGAVGKFGGRMPHVYIVGAGTLTEHLLVAGAAGGSYYVGAAIGSLAVATGRYLGCGSRLVDALAVAEEIEHGSRARWVRGFLWGNPEVVLPGHPSRPHFRMKIVRASREVA